MNLRSALIFAKDMKRMIAFYRDGLGLRLLDETAKEGWAEFDAGGALLALHEVPADIAKGIHVASPPRPRESTPIKLVFQAENMDEARAHLAQHGAVMFEPSAWGACDGLDPEGNVFQIVAA